MKYVEIKVPVKVPKEGCEGCEHFKHYFGTVTFCELFPTKKGFARIIYNYRPCKQCMEARALRNNRIVENEIKIKW